MKGRKKKSLAPKTDQIEDENRNLGTHALNPEMQHKKNVMRAPERFHFWGCFLKELFQTDKRNCSNSNLIRF